MRRDDQPEAPGGGMADHTPGLIIADYWAQLNEDLVALVDFVPDDRLDWNPRPELYTFRRILTHIAGCRDGWLADVVRDGVDAPDVHATVHTRADMQQAYRRTWQRIAAFLANAAQLDAAYEDEGRTIDGHWIAFHLLEHDIHHRADLLHYLALLDIAAPTSLNL
jgi:uncharacterized damage-inducible protein DinB